MQYKRRSAFKVLSAIAAIYMCGLPIPSEAGLFDGVIDVAVRVQDEEGKPISFVTVWGYIEKPIEHTRQTTWPMLHLKAGDLWRISQRYNGLHDIISQVGDNPVPYLLVEKLGTEDGIFSSVLDYQELTGKGNHYARPDNLKFGYTFMKHGYLPGKVDFSVSKFQSSVDAVVTLQRDPATQISTAPYVQTFERVRYELSDLRRNEEMTQENLQRLKGLQARLEQAAQQAIAAGDKPAAARIYSRMRYLPSITVIDGRIAGYSQGDANSEQAKRAMDMAYQLDPDNLYVWMQTYLRRMQLPPNPTREQRAAAALKEVEKLIAARGEAVWPRYYNARAGGTAMLGDYAKAYRLYLDAAQIEPKYMDWDEAIQKLKSEMRRKGVEIPVDSK